MIDAFREDGGEGKPVTLQVHLSLGADEERGARASPTTSGARNVFAPPLRWDLETRRAVRRRRQHVRPEDVHEPVLVSADLGRHVEWLARARRRSASTRLYLHHVGQEQRPFIEAFGEHVLPRADERPRPTSDLWWKNAVVYCLDVETFLDRNGDGCGDFAGLTERLDYLAGIGVSCLWLMPFYPRRAATTATTSPTSTASTRGSARSATSSSSSAPPRTAASG